ncbi:MAG: hypothetical protein WC382_06755 [Methanoregulaceae archaeon]|jgi:hypothetical protein
MKFEEAERVYGELKVKRDAGELGAKEFSDSLEKMTVKDKEGVLWRLSDLDGDWLRWNGSAWDPDIPLLFKKDYSSASVDREYTWTHIGCNPGDLGIEFLQTPVRETLPYEPGEIPALPPLTATDDAYAVAQDGIADQAFGEAREEARMKTVTFKKTLVSPRSFQQLAYPFWVVRYRYKGRGYLAVLDGATGTVVSGRAPGDVLYNGLAGAAGSVAAGGLIAVSAVTLPTVGFDIEGLLLAAFPLIIGLIVIAWTYDVFRYGSEVVVDDLSRNRRKTVIGRFKGIIRRLPDIAKDKVIDLVQGGLGW